MFIVKCMAKACVKFRTVQISVVVASIQAKILKTELGGVPCEQQWDMG